VLNLTHIPTTADADMPPPPLSAPDAAASDGREEGWDAKIDESEEVASGNGGGNGRGGFASFLYAVLCIAGFLFVIPSDALGCDTHRRQEAPPRMICTGLSTRQK
jgi:hypothetical protein